MSTNSGAATGGRSQFQGKFGNQFGVSVGGGQFGGVGVGSATFGTNRPQFSQSGKTKAGPSNISMPTGPFATLDDAQQSKNMTRNKPTAHQDSVAMKRLRMTMRWTS